MPKELIHFPIEVELPSEALCTGAFHLSSP